MGLLDDAIREHLELKRRRGANPDEVARQEEAALGPPRRGDFAQPGAEPAAVPAEDFERPPAEQVRIRPVEDDREPFADEVPEFDPLGADEPAAAAYEPAPAADEVAPYEPAPAEDDVARYEPAPAEQDVARYERAPAEQDVARHERAPREEDLAPAEPEADLGDLPGPGPADVSPAPPGSPAWPAEPVTRRRAPADDWLDDEPDEVPTEDALERPRPAAEPEPEPEARPGDEDVLEETPEFLQETPEHDRLWFEQRPPRDFDFDK
jgi:hypothetical protein